MGKDTPSSGALLGAESFYIEESYRCSLYNVLIIKYIRNFLYSRGDKEK